MIRRLFEAVWDRLRDWWELPYMPLLVVAGLSWEAAIVYHLLTNGG